MVKFLPRLIMLRNFSNSSAAFNSLKRRWRENETTDLFSVLHRNIVSVHSCFVCRKILLFYSHKHQSLAIGFSPIGMDYQRFWRVWDVRVHSLVCWKELERLYGTVLLFYRWRNCNLRRRNVLSKLTHGETSVTFQFPWSLLIDLNEVWKSQRWLFDIIR